MGDVYGVTVFDSVPVDVFLNFYIRSRHRFFFYKTLEFLWRRCEGEKINKYGWKKSMHLGKSLIVIVSPGL